MTCSPATAPVNRWEPMTGSLIEKRKVPGTEYPYPARPVPPRHARYPPESCPSPPSPRLGKPPLPADNDQTRNFIEYAHFCAVANTRARVRDEGTVDVAVVGHVGVHHAGRESDRSEHRGCPSPQAAPPSSGIAIPLARLLPGPSRRRSHSAAIRDRPAAPRCNGGRRGSSKPTPMLTTASSMSGASLRGRSPRSPSQSRASSYPRATASMRNRGSATRQRMTRA